MAVFYWSALSTAPLTAKDEEQLAVTQRKMLRLIIGYVKTTEDSWADIYRRLRSRLASALAQKTIQEWVPALRTRKERLGKDVAAGARNKLTCTVATWCPQTNIDPKFSFRSR